MSTKDKEMILLGDEAIAMGAVHAGMTAAYAYPGTPSTEILQFLIDYKARKGGFEASWSANEKTSLEEALGVSIAGRRSLVAMKHVGLNVAADPLMNSALVDIHGGVVIVVADDPGMHSSQNEQDSRYYADFGRLICLEPRDNQEAYDMTREAFDISEKFKLPVMIRIVTRLAHARSVVKVKEQRDQNPIDKVEGAFNSWVMLPGNARRQWSNLLEQWPQIEKFTEESSHNTLKIENGSKLGVITTGIAGDHYVECLGELDQKPSHLHISAYPFPKNKMRELAANVDKIMIIEEGYPYIERYMRGILDTKVQICGKLSGELPEDGEMNPDLIRKAFGIPTHEGPKVEGLTLPGRPPQLCKGCSHEQSFTGLLETLKQYDASKTIVTGDIGCSTLAALPPYQAIESCLCMGASVSMAKGAAEAGLHPVVAVIGDSTFVHSGMTGLVDAIKDKTNMTVLILDNQTTAMTGGQPTAVPTEQFKPLVIGLGADPEHVINLDAHRKQLENNIKALKAEFDYEGLSVVILERECIETARKKKKTK